MGYLAVAPAILDRGIRHGLWHWGAIVKVGKILDPCLSPKHVQLSV